MDKILSVLILIFTINVQAEKTQIVTKKVSTKSNTETIVTTTINNFQHELEISESSGYISMYKVGTKSYTDISAYLGYSYDLVSSFQVGGDVGVRVYDSDTYLTIVGTTTFNFENDYTNSVFAKLGVGIYPSLQANGEVESDSGFFLGLGKRFFIRKHFNFKPYFAISKVGDSDPGLTINFLNFTFNW